MNWKTSLETSNNFLKNSKPNSKKLIKNLKTLEEWWFKKIDGYGPWTSDQ